MPPRDGEPFLLYISASEDSIGSFLAQKNEEGTSDLLPKSPYLIKGQEKNDTNIEKMCLCLYFTAVKLRHYLLPRQTSCEGENRFDPTHVIDTISQRSDWKMGFCLVRVFIQLFTTTIGQRTGGSRIFDKSSVFLRQAIARSGWWRSCVWPQLHGKCISMAPVRKVAREQVLLFFSS